MTNLNYKEKAELMKQLINLYEQVENIEPKASRLIVQAYIRKNEFKLLKKLQTGLWGVKDE